MGNLHSAVPVTATRRDTSSTERGSGLRALILQCTRSPFLGHRDSEYQGASGWFGVNRQPLRFGCECYKGSMSTSNNRWNTSSLLTGELKSFDLRPFSSTTIHEIYIILCHQPVRTATVPVTLFTAPTRHPFKPRCLYAGSYEFSRSLLFTYRIPSVPPKGGESLLVVRQRMQGAHPLRTLCHDALSLFGPRP
ncbi:uncharacterized protein EI97DRAFT_432990 [Westerdykella ornata]|uniref:Uncharacterized protein n=1 Tax=Westerdykella ornata TaxID=318751 RepID=A0A6A6JJJ0_WESOR|nr:uncharacterized protein EI97DRAFT_432990 [Westerdykella ornata]KAF2276751.1 hypothetical protein EI97DRAFT_432990 [Westerdykella ornata]